VTAGERQRRRGLRCLGECKGMRRRRVNGGEGHTEIMKRKLRSFDAPGDWGGGGGEREREFIVNDTCITGGPGIENTFYLRGKEHILHKNTFYLHNGASRTSRGLSPTSLSLSLTRYQEHQQVPKS